MLNTIIDVLNKKKIENYKLDEMVREAAELYFIKKHTDMRRSNKVHEYVITVYNDFEKDGKKMRGASYANIYPGMTEEEIAKVVDELYFAASFVNNAYYELPDPVKEDMVVMESTLGEVSLEEGAAKMAEALFAADNDDEAFVNSAEFFVRKTKVSIIASNGTDVSYIKYSASGEFVVQCSAPQDVEFYQDFRYDGLATEELTKKVSDALAEVKARAKATEAPKAGAYDIILSAEHVSDLLSYYSARSNAAMVYPGYSNYKLGTKVQGDEVKGEKLNITFEVSEPYSGEGIKMKKRALLENGELKLIHGGNRLCRYLGIEPTGDYGKKSVHNGSVTFEEMKQDRCLHIVKFSDFQMDSYSGHFGGEIRLAYLYEDGKVTYVTGGSINGSIADVQGDMVFSKETYSDSRYEGPFAVKLKNVSVAGI